MYPRYGTEHGYTKALGSFGIGEVLAGRFAWSRTGSLSVACTSPDRGKTIAATRVGASASRAETCTSEPCSAVTGYFRRRRP